MKISMIVAWYGSSVTTLLFAILFLVYLSTPKIIQPNIQSFKLYAALPANNISFSETIQKSDARAKLIENFFKDYQAPLDKYGDLFVRVADKYNLDWRLLPAISMQESNGGRRIISGSFNAFGYGIYGKLITRFSGWEEAIERVGRALREDYLNQGLKTPQTIMAKYTPPSLAKGGTWARGVNSFMAELR